MKHMKKSMFFSTILMVVLLIVALSTATFAWFTSNEQVSATETKLTAAKSSEANITIDWLNEADDDQANWRPNQASLKFNDITAELEPKIPTAPLAGVANGTDLYATVVGDLDAGEFVAGHFTSGNGFNVTADADYMNIINLTNDEIANIIVPTGLNVAPYYIDDSGADYTKMYATKGYGVVTKEEYDTTSTSLKTLSIDANGTAGNEYVVFGVARILVLEDGLTSTEEETMISVKEASGRNSYITSSLAVTKDDVANGTNYFVTYYRFKAVAIDAVITDGVTPANGTGTGTEEADQLTVLDTFGANAYRHLAEADAALNAGDISIADAITKANLGTPSTAYKAQVKKLYCLAQAAVDGNIANMQFHGATKGASGEFNQDAQGVASASALTGEYAADADTSVIVLANVGQAISKNIELSINVTSAGVKLNDAQLSTLKVAVFRAGSYYGDYTHIGTLAHTESNVYCGAIHKSANAKTSLQYYTTVTSIDLGTLDANEATYLKVVAWIDGVALGDFDANGYMTADEVLKGGEALNFGLDFDASSSTTSEVTTD